MAVNFQCNAPIIQLERIGAKLKLHMNFNTLAEAQRYFIELQTALETEGLVSLSFISDGPVSKQ